MDGVGRRGEVPPSFSLSHFSPSLPPLSLPLALATQGSIFCKVFSRLNRRAKV